MLNHLQAINRVINSKSTLPILDCFLLELKGEKLTLTAADSETRLETWVDVNSAEGEGTLAINAKNLLDPLRELPDQPLTFEINDETLEVFIYYKNGKYNFVGLKGDEYPEPKPLKEDSAMSLTIDSEMLLSGINRTVFATAGDELRPVMNGISVDITSENLTFVASDGHKLVRVTTTESRGDGRSSFILPKKPANLLKSILPRESGNIEINFDENNAYITMGNYKMVCRFVEGRYPNYNSVIPQNNTNSVTLDRLSLLNALKRVSVFSNPSIGLVKLQLSEDKIIITLSKGSKIKAPDFKKMSLEEITEWSSKNKVKLDDVLTYEITVENKSELDYNDINYYRYGNNYDESKLVKIKLNSLADYVDQKLSITYDIGSEGSELVYYNSSETKAKAASITLSMS